MSGNITLGFLAHVDAGKTTLSEAVLFKTGVIRKAGRVDHKDAFLDNNAIERERGITVYSKEARFDLGGKQFVILDTPGHSDFSTEMERTLRVLDYAILVVSGIEGVESHTVTLWRLFKTYNIPVFIFVNKMDRDGADRVRIINQLKVSFGEGIIEINGTEPKDCEAVALCSEEMMEEYLQSGSISDQSIAKKIKERKLFPVMFGSALKMEGIDELLGVIDKYSIESDVINTDDSMFGARVYKITRDAKGNRQTHLRVICGRISSKMVISGTNQSGEPWEEKIEQIRLYSGTGFEMTQEAGTGMVICVTGLSQTYAGQGLGIEARSDEQNGVFKPVIEPALTYEVILINGEDPMAVFPKLKLIEEENPSFEFNWDEEVKEIHVNVMGDLELEILKYRLAERFGLNVEFGQGSIIYKESILAPVSGVGHYEPLRHYAEVRIIAEPLPYGSGIEYGSLVSFDDFPKNWQRLVTTHLMERKHKGCLTGSEITDVKFNIIAGAWHNKHTEGGDFRQATYRAVRNAFRRAMDEGKAVLLEPVYSFSLEVPADLIGRAMTDMERLHAKCDLPDMTDDGTMGVLRGTGPVATLREYPRELNTYARGKGRFTATLDGYAPCHNQKEVIEKRAYDCDLDKWNSCGSVFCEHGAGMYVEWDRVEDCAHTEMLFKIDDAGNFDKIGEAEAEYLRMNGQLGGNIQKPAGGNMDFATAGNDELRVIFEKTYGKSKRDEQLLKQQQMIRNRRPENSAENNFPQPNWKSKDGKQGKGTAEAGKTGNGKNGTRMEPYLIIDGYNVIFRWEELKDLASVNLDAAREVLLESLENYQGYEPQGIMVVFDGYKVAGNPGTKHEYADIKVIYTKEAETADRFIEKAVFEMKGKYDLTVVTSDRAVQMAAFGDGAKRISSGEFYAIVMSTAEEIRQKLKKTVLEKNTPFKNILCTK